jgi:hypothetical protein
MGKKSIKREIPKAVSEMNGFKIGDSVMIKSGTKDPDNEKESIGGWCGRIKELYNDSFVLIKWNSKTIQEMKIAQIKKHEKQGNEWAEMYLVLDDIEKCSPRDEEDDAEEEISKIQWQYFRKEYFPEYDDDDE